MWPLVADLVVVFVRARFGWGVSGGAALGILWSQRASCRQLACRHGVSGWSVFSGARAVSLRKDSGPCVLGGGFLRGGSAFPLLLLVVCLVGDAVAVCGGAQLPGQEWFSGVLVVFRGSAFVPPSEVCLTSPLCWRALSLTTAFPLQTG